ncbi:MAG TPA: putative porin [Edaphocola sp.]|nr:putative porin [Edaphocola sp.]
MSFSVHAQNKVKPKNDKRFEGTDPFNPSDPNDTSKIKKPMGSDWDEEPAVISYKYYDSEVTQFYDTTLLFFHRNQYQQPVWYHDLGNWGAPARNLYFDPNTKPGVRLGYNFWDVYKYTMDSIPFIHTTRPYTSFSFMLGSKELQWVEFLHTQNINPRWNFAFKVSNNSSDGFFNIQKATGLNAFLNTNYKSKDERYKSFGAFVVNNFKQDENGGIQNDSFLLIDRYNNRVLIPVNIDPLGSTVKSPVSNKATDLELFYSQSYAWGKVDSIYNEDSTKVDYTFTPRFSIRHVFDLKSDRHFYQDIGPNREYYSFIDTFSFRNNIDTVRARQSLFTLDNKFSLNTFLGKDSQLVHLEAGIGIQYDRFGNSVQELDSPKVFHGYLSNYLFGQLRKDALKEGQWAYNADLEFLFTGPSIGNFKAGVRLSKSFPKLGMFTLGANQSLTSASFQEKYLRTKFFEINNAFNNSSTTQLYGSLYVKAMKMNVSLRNILMGNYIYLDESLNWQQYNSIFSVLQLSAKKIFYFGAFSLDNEMVAQQLAGNAPVHLPLIMLRHQFAYKVPMFKDRLDALIGIEARFNSSYKADAYNAVWNQFYYQNDVTLNNYPALSAFFNFKVKRLRAFVMGDQIQQMIWKKNVMLTPGYPAPNAHFRFGFNWLMMN